MNCAPSRHLGALAAILWLALTLPLGAADEVDPRAVAALEQFLARPVIAHPYSAARRLEASGSGQRAWLDVQTDFTPGSGLSYQVVAEGGSGLIRSRVLRSLLQEEQKLIARRATASIALSTDNYQFIPGRVDEDGLAVVATQPLRKDRSLIAGRMFLTLEGDLTRLEGRLAKNPSFWTTRVDVVRSYRRVNGVLMPVSLESAAQLRMFGTSALRMTYRYSHVDERAVEDDPRQ